MKRLNLTSKGLKIFAQIQERYEFLSANYPHNAGDMTRFGYGHIDGSLVDLAMGYNGSSAKSLINGGLAEYDDNGRWEVSYMGEVINA